VPSAPGESEYLTRRRRIDPLLQAEGGTVIPFAPGTPAATCTAHAVTVYATASGPADYALFGNGRPLAGVEAKRPSLGPQNVLTQAGWGLPPRCSFNSLRPTIPR
jgi:type I restriction enzyme R subunit